MKSSAFRQNSVLFGRQSQHLYELQTLAQQSGYTLAQMALAWVLRKQIVSAAIIGATRPQQVEENAKASEMTLTDDVIRRIDEILVDVVKYDR